MSDAKTWVENLLGSAAHSNYDGPLGLKGNLIWILAQRPAESLKFLVNTAKETLSDPSQWPRFSPDVLRQMAAVVLNFRGKTAEEISQAVRQEVTKGGEWNEERLSRLTAILEVLLAQSPHRWRLSLLRLRDEAADPRLKERLEKILKENAEAAQDPGLYGSRLLFFMEDIFPSGENALPKKIPNLFH